MENRVAHLGFIQEVIKRMASNSFLIKGWSVTLVSAIFALSAKEPNSNIILIAYFPAIMFWLLDAYYLHQERLFRKLYEQTIETNSKIPAYSLDTKQIKHLVKPYTEVIKSKSILLFHGVLLLVVIAITFLSKT